MRDRIVRVVLAIFAFVSLQLGIWATFAPRSFYEDYPGFGREWVRVDGPYNEHFVRDFGALNLALAVVTIAALVTMLRPLVIAVAIAWLAWGVPHLVYHLRHLDVFSTTDKVLNVTALVALPVLAVVVLVLTLQRPARA
jgi:Ca2+/Na+ antiporter